MVSDRATIIEKGRVRYSGTIAELDADATVQQEYLSV